MFLYDFNEIWFTWETWYPELIGDDEIFFQAAIFQMAANFLTIFLISPISIFKLENLNFAN